jgi:leucyl-tRNA synthetase
MERVSHDLEGRFHFNTAIAALMELVNGLSQFEIREDSDRCVLGEALKTMVHLLSPFAPHLAEELWQKIGGSGEVSQAPWPLADRQALRKEEYLMVIQINGKLRLRMTVPVFKTEEEIKAMALNQPRIKELVGAKSIKKIIVVPQRVMNIVIEENK